MLTRVKIEFTSTSFLTHLWKETEKEPSYHEGENIFLPGIIFPIEVKRIEKYLGEDLVSIEKIEIICESSSNNNDVELRKMGWFVLQK